MTPNPVVEWKTYLVTLVVGFHEAHLPLMDILQARLTTEDMAGVRV
jgi:hypothetical protein